jgi:hypothetical protein
MGQELRGELPEEQPVEAEALPEKKGHPEHRTVVENSQPKIKQAWTPAGHVNPPLTEINRSAMKDWADRAADAIKVTNAELIKVLGEEENTLSPIERAHGPRQVQVQHHRDGNRKIQAIDGLRTPQNSTETRQRHADNLARFQAENAARFK